MIKTIVSLLFCFAILMFINTYVLIINPQAFAQAEPSTQATKKATATVTPVEEKSKIDEIKDKIASTVAQLNLVSKKGVMGEITKIEKTQLTIERNGETRQVDVDEITAYNELVKNKKELDKYSAKDKQYTIPANTVTTSRFGPSGSLKNENIGLENTIAVIPSMINEIFFDLKYIFTIIP